MMRCACIRINLAHAAQIADVLHCYTIMTSFLGRAKSMLHPHETQREGELILRL